MGDHLLLGFALMACWNIKIHATKRSFFSNTLLHLKLVQNRYQSLYQDWFEFIIFFKSYLLNSVLEQFTTIEAVDSEYGIYLVDGTYLTLYEHNFGIDYLNNLMMEQESFLYHTQERYHTKIVPGRVTCPLNRKDFFADMQDPPHFG